VKPVNTWYQNGCGCLCGPPYNSTQSFELYPANFPKHDTIKPGKEGAVEVPVHAIPEVGRFVGDAECTFVYSLFFLRSHHSFDERPNISFEKLNEIVAFEDV
jgi:hypothetical protein